MWWMPSIGRMAVPCRSVVDGPAAAAREEAAAGGTLGSGLRLVLLDGRDVERELDLVGDEHVAAAERLVELHAVVAAGELAGDLEADPLVAPRVDVDALDLGVQGDLAASRRGA